MTQGTVDDGSTPNNYMYGTIHNSGYVADQSSSYGTNFDPQNSYQNIPQYQTPQNLTSYDVSHNYQQQNLQYNQQNVTNDPALSQYTSNYSQYSTPTGISANIETSNNQVHQNYNQSQTSNVAYSQPDLSNQATIQSQTIQPQVPTSTPAPSNPIPKPEQKHPSKNSNIDLLLGIDFLTNIPSDIGSDILQPEPLKPIDSASDILIPTPAPSIIDSKSQVDAKVSVEPQTKIQIQPKPPTPIESNDRIREFILSNTSIDRKSSFDNLSTVSDLSSNDPNYDWESASAKNDDASKSSRDDNLNVILMKYKNPFEDQKVLKNFHKEIERLEKLIEMLNVKNLNGTTQLDGKWKDLQDLLVC